MADLIDILVPLEQEGTTAQVSNWFFQPGDAVAEGDPLLELETDKVALEVPAPTSGVLQEIALKAGAEANPGDVLGKIVLAAARDTPERHFSPAVRRILAEAGIDGSAIMGTGRGGRITKADAEAYVRREKIAPPPPVAPLKVAQPVAAPVPASTPAEHVPHTAMRRAIARHMAHSVATAPHVTSVFEADFSAIMRHRDAHQAEYAQRGIKLTFTAYMLVACVEAMKAAPMVNSQWQEDSVKVFKDVNIGVGTALGDDGLIVPVCHKAQELSLQGIALRLQEMTNRARGKTLLPEDTKGGTFTVSNHGVSGSLVASPIIINQPQSAILGVGKLEKRVCVVEVDGQDTIQIRPKAFVSLSIDHRVLDGHLTNAWLSRFVETLETWPQDG